MLAFFSEDLLHKKRMKGNKGITLIALVITIIVLLILAAVSIAMLSGDNSILKRGNEAATNTAIATGKEKVAMAINEALTEYSAIAYGSPATATTIPAQINLKLNDQTGIAKAANWNVSGTTGQTYTGFTDSPAEGATATFSFTVVSNNTTYTATITTSGGITWNN